MSVPKQQTYIYRSSLLQLVKVWCPYKFNPFGSIALNRPGSYPFTEADVKGKGVRQKDYTYKRNSLI